MQFNLSTEQCIQLRELANEYIANNDRDYKEWLKNLFSINKIEFEAKYNWDILIHTEEHILSLQYKKEY